MFSANDAQLKYLHATPVRLYACTKRSCGIRRVALYAMPLHAAKVLVVLSPGLFIWPPACDRYSGSQSTFL
jgi:hypothetical protein